MKYKCDMTRRLAPIDQMPSLIICVQDLAPFSDSTALRSGAICHILPERIQRHSNGVVMSLRIAPIGGKYADGRLHV